MQFKKEKQKLYFKFLYLIGNNFIWNTWTSELDIHLFNLVQLEVGLLSFTLQIHKYKLQSLLEPIFRNTSVNYNLCFFVNAISLAGEINGLTGIAQKQSSWSLIVLNVQVPFFPKNIKKKHFLTVLVHYCHLILQLVFEPCNYTVYNVFLTQCTW